MLARGVSDVHREAAALKEQQLVLKLEVGKLGRAELLMRQKVSEAKRYTFVNLIRGPCSRLMFSSDTCTYKRYHMRGGSSCEDVGALSSTLHACVHASIAPPAVHLPLFCTTVPWLSFAGHKNGFRSASMIPYYVL